MPRRPRIYLAGHPQHIVQRGHNRAACFFAEEDYRFYLHWLKLGAERHGCDLHAYVLNQPRASSADATAAGCGVPADAVTRAALCAVCQPVL